MIIDTIRFGPVEVQADDVLHFASGLVGFEDCTHWVLLADADNEAVAWLQSTARPDVAMAVVSPRRFVPQYQLRVTADQLAPVKFEEAGQVYVLAVVSKGAESLTINLRAPVVINLGRRLGRQVVASDDQPLQYKLSVQPAPLRKTA